MADLYDVMQAAMRGEPAEAPPIGKLLGMSMVAVSPGKSTMELAADERMANPMGTLHGGVLCDLADAAMGMAFATTLGRGETFTTLELKINFLKPVWRSRLRAEGRVVKAGRTVSLIECDVFDEGGSLVARATSTCLTLRGAAAQGR
jgi:uncharacterized protein (TIGR00369 family)